MNWIVLEHLEQLEKIKSLSVSKPQVIFKHSTRCATSSMVLGRLERSQVPEGIDFYFLDLLKYRQISNQVAADFSVHHESPQVLLIQNRECTFEESHHGIEMEEIAGMVNK